MKKVLSILIFFTFFKASAQKNFSWQIVAEINGNKASTAGLDWQYFYSEYKIIDTAASLFTKINRETGQHVTSQESFGEGLGLQFNYKVKNRISINVGIKVSSNSIKRTITEFKNMTDSSEITLQNTGPYQWYDTENGYQLYKGVGGLDMNGQTVEFIGWRAPDYGKPLGYKNRIPSKETIKFISIEVPLGVTYNPSRSKFAFFGELNPVFILKSFISPKYVFDPSRISGSEENPPFHIDKTNSIIWQFIAGFSYKINTKTDVGLKYKKSFSSLVNNDDIKFSSVAVQISYALSNFKL